MTTDNSPDVPETADPAPLERSERLIEEARAASHEALSATEGDRAPGAGSGEEPDVAQDSEEPDVDPHA